jgi:hypothetical protein
MVKFLLHNTIGAWWCAQHGITGPPGGAGVPKGRASVEMEYLRWRDDGTPAAGSFDAWPKTLKEFTMLDPCCGSGHFLVEAFRLLVPLRMHDEGLSAKKTSDAVLSENLFGLELDPRCTQIAAFALAVAAWKYPDELGQPLGYRLLPPLNIACSGQSVTGKKEEWLVLANSDSRLLEGMDKLYDLFQQAPHLGSLIDPRREAGNLIASGFPDLQPLLEKVLAKDKVQQDADASAIGVAAEGISRSTRLLTQAYTLVATNVPYLARRKQTMILCSACEDSCESAKQNLAVVFVKRCLDFASDCGTVALVTPQDWLFLDIYEEFRRSSLMISEWNTVIKLGPKAFQTPMWDMNIMLFIATKKQPLLDFQFSGIDISAINSAFEKPNYLKISQILSVHQYQQLSNPDSRVIFGDVSEGKLLGNYATALMGVSVGDSIRFERCFWEISDLGNDWEYLQSTVSENIFYGGRSSIILWEQQRGKIYRLAESVKHLNHAAQNWLRGKPNWGKLGVSVSQMANLPCTLYYGNIYDCNCCAVVPNDERHLPALWAFCSSNAFVKEVRKINQALKVPPHTLLKVPFDLSYWSKVSESNGDLPEPFSNEPTQWLFRGDISSSTEPLQVGIARLLGYRWPEQPEYDDALDVFADKDSIVCIPAVRGERPAAERLLDILRTAYGGQWSDAILHKLLIEVGCRPGTSLDDWLRDRFFEQHSKCFHHRPFIWHIWDGRKDGFSCLVNYHKLTHQRLETLTYAYLQDWITAQAAAAREGKPGADLRLAAAQELQNKLKLILEGEPPYDIFVRWKPIHAQPIGWNPDLNDGVRVNIRPFVAANVLRKPPNIKWTKDRGKDPERDSEQFPWLWKNGAFTGDRINDFPLTNAQKRAAREKAGQG